MGTPVPVFESAWPMALPEEGFSNQEPYQLLHPDKQQIVDRA